MNSATFKRKKKQEAYSQEEQSSVHTLKTWMHQLEQHIQSITARLHAIENRLAPDIDDLDFSQHDINEHFKSLQTQNSNQIPSEKNVVNKDYEAIRAAVSTLQQEQQRLQEAFSHQQKTSLKQAVIMRVGSKELPLEITGIIAGSLALLVAVLIAIGGKDLVISPPFLVVIGVILIGSSFVRSTGLFSLLLNWFSHQKKQHRKKSYQSSIQSKESGSLVDSGNQ